jgi:hypothetical protein
MFIHLSSRVDHACQQRADARRSRETFILCPLVLTMDVISNNPLEALQGHLKRPRVWTPSGHDGREERSAAGYCGLTPR